MMKALTSKLCIQPFPCRSHSVLPEKKFKEILLSKQNNLYEIYDVRSPLEFSSDHVPGSINIPIFSDSERVTVGSNLNKNPKSILESAGLALGNISTHLMENKRISDNFNSSVQKSIIVICQRGRKRSQAMAFILSELFGSEKVFKLEGGYKTYRNIVRNYLNNLDEYFPNLYSKTNVICGLTGVGKTMALKLIEDKLNLGSIDLEFFAGHRGSIIGNINSSQTNQKSFESQIFWKLNQLSSKDLQIFIEDESRKIGPKCSVPQLLHDAMISCQSKIIITASTNARVEYILKVYNDIFNIENRPSLDRICDQLSKYVGSKNSNSWKNLINQERYSEFVAEMLKKHYDVGYRNARKYLDDNRYKKVHLEKITESEMVKNLLPILE